MATASATCSGITARLSYLAELGVDAVWISPIFRSPMKDFGYDISDYTAIDPLFGSMADFDQLLQTAHSLGLKVLLDFVPNHSSDQHPWFIESRSSRTNPKRDWYLWRDPAPGGGPPNNWLSEFGGSAWEFDATIGPILLSRVSGVAARPELAQSRRGPRDARRAAILDAQGRRRLSGRRHLASHQGRRLQGQSTQSGLSSPASRRIRRSCRCTPRIFLRCTTSSRALAPRGRRIS